MDVTGKIVVVTGGASGIGRALCERFAAEGAAAIVVADIDEQGIDATVTTLNKSQDTTQVMGVYTDVAKEQDIKQLVSTTQQRFGPVDLFCSNAGVFTTGDENVANEEWQKIWNINVMSHIYAARHLLPAMVARGEGYLLSTASAAGLLSQIGSAPYSVTKHAVIGFAEWLSITYGRQGIKVSVLCPQAVRTEMIAGSANGGVAGVDGILEPEQVADTVVEALASERFLILPHPEVLTYMRRKTDDYDRWLGGMQRLNQQVEDNDQSN